MVLKKVTWISTLNVEDAVSGITLDVDAENVNNTDVWVQTINADGTVIANWTKVNEVFGTNVTPNNLADGVRNTPSVKSHSTIKLVSQFADSLPGNLMVLLEFGIEQV